MKLVPLEKEHLADIARWRDAARGNLRTAAPCSFTSQERFLKSLAEPGCPHRYWAVINKDDHIGIGGLTNIQWENRLAEISLVMNPDESGRGLGKQAVDLLLIEAFRTLNLETVCGECYENNKDGIKFWTKIVDNNNGYKTKLKMRKFWNGLMYDSMYFSLDRYYGF